MMTRTAKHEEWTNSTETPYWRRNLVVCLLGSFTTLVAMTLLLPYLPLYVEQLGVHDHAAVVQWSGIAYAATFFAAALTAPLWGRLSDRFGRKSMLIRASLGLAIAMCLMGLVQDVWQLVGLRILVGLLGGYSSGAILLVAGQAPKSRSAWALGVLSTGAMAGNVAGPLLGGVVPDSIGVRPTFFAIGAAIFVTFLGTAFLIKEHRPVHGGAPTSAESPRRGWAQVPDKPQVLGLLATAALLMLATMSIEPIITVYVAQLAPGSMVATMSGVVMALGALGSVLSAPRLGRVADRVGHMTVIWGCLLTAAILLVLQAWATSIWMLAPLRFGMGLCLGGLLPSITAAIRHQVPDDIVGRALGLSVSAQYTGQVAGPILGGFVGGHLGMRAVFYATSVLLLAGSIYIRLTQPRAK